MGFITIFHHQRQIHRSHEAPKDENAPMPHAHVGTELVYATDRADLEPPFKVFFFVGLRLLSDVMGWDTI